MSKLVYLISLFTLSFLMPTTGYSSAVPTSTKTTQKTIELQKRIKKKFQKKRRKKRPHAQNSAGGAIAIIFAISIPVTGLILLIVGLAMGIAGLWIAGIVILGILLVLAAIFLILLATSGPWE